MATPNELKVTVDLTNGEITKITDKNSEFSGKISLKNDDLDNSKAKLKAAVDVMNSKRPLRFGRNIITDQDLIDAVEKEVKNASSGHVDLRGWTTPANAAPPPAADGANAAPGTDGNNNKLGGARKRRLSRRRPHGSNRKKSLVRNKSKKMRRGKYSIKAK